MDNISPDTNYLTKPGICNWAQASNHSYAVGTLGIIANPPKLANHRIIKIKVLLTLYRTYLQYCHIPNVSN